MAKFTVEFNDQLNASLEELAREQNIPKTQVIRRSIALLKYLEDEKKRGNKITVANQNDQVVKEIVTA